jgi:hypothetical protein
MRPHRAAKRAGHRVAVAEARYADLVEVPSDARALEATMQIEIEWLICGCDRSGQPGDGSVARSEAIGTTLAR